jgi:hypothetical protein
VRQRRSVRPALVLASVLLSSGAVVAVRRSVADTVASLSPSNLSGTWTGTLSHDGETRIIGLRLETTDARRLVVTFSNPAIDVRD